MGGGGEDIVARGGFMLWGPPAGESVYVLLGVMLI